MMTRQLVSEVTPLAGESLGSYLFRLQVEAELSNDRLHPLLAGTILNDAFMCERRAFDWTSVSRFVNAEPEVLHTMSQRGLLHAMEHERPCQRMIQKAPWLNQRGYGAYCPVCLKESAHWRKSWINPSAVVCQKHRTVLVRHCPHCHSDLAKTTWSNTTPVCPTCHTHLSFGPVIMADEPLINEAAVLEKRFDAMLDRAPLQMSDFELACFAGMWRTASLFARKRQDLAALRLRLLHMRGIESVIAPEDSPTVVQARERAFDLIAAHLLFELEPELAQHHWLVTDRRTSSARLDDGLLARLMDVASSLGVFVPALYEHPPQCCISFTNWSVSKAILRAA